MLNWPDDPNPPELPREEIVGRTLVEIRQLAESNDERGMDWTLSFFVLDSGKSFTLPLASSTSIADQPFPAEAKRFDAPENGIYGQRITAVLRAAPDTDLLDDSPYLLLENGYVLTDIMGDYYGTGSTGVYVYAPGELDISLLLPFWE